MKTKETELARRILDLIPPLMHQVRLEVRAAAQDRLTIPQFRILNQIDRGLRHVGQIADHHGISQPAMSKMIDGLVKRGLVKRAPGKTDRRQVVLSLTPSGSTLLQEVKKAARAEMNRGLKRLSADEVNRLHEAFDQIEALLLKRGD